MPWKPQIWNSPWMKAAVRSTRVRIVSASEIAANNRCKQREANDYQMASDANLRKINMKQLSQFRVIQQSATIAMVAIIASALTSVPAASVSQSRSMKASRTPTLESAITDGTKQHDTIRSISKTDGSFPVLIGAASNAKFWDTDSYEILNREFAYVTPGNDFKQTAIHPQPGQWNWKTADEWVARCKANGQIMRLHSAISPQCSKWAKADARTGDELKANLVEYLTELSKRYNDQSHIRWMDVVNETVSRNGEWFGPREGNDRWENPWTQIGFDQSHPLKPPAYIKMAFEIANEHAPHIKLIYNQHGGMEPAMWDKVKDTIEYLQDAGVRVDGVGWQGHIDTGFERDPENVKQLRLLIEWAQSRNLGFHVTEFNAWIRKKNKTDPITADDLQAQAKTYGEVLSVLNEYSEKGVVTWCTWQIKDTETERGHLQGNLFDGDAQPKPAYRTLLNLLKAISKN